MVFDTDLALITLALGFIGYGIYTRSSRAAEDNTTTPPPQQFPTTPTQLPHLPGVPQDLLLACSKAVDAPGATLAGPVAPKGMEPDRVKDVVSAMIKRIQHEDIICTAIDGGTCVADAEGSEQYELTCVLYEKATNVSLQMHVGILALDDGRFLITKLTPESKVQGEDPLANEDPWKINLAPYSLPIDGV